MKITAGQVVTFVLVLIAAIFVAALFIPGSIDASAKSRQKSTMSDIREIANAIEQFAAEHQYYPAVESFLQLKPLLEPKYLPILKTQDRWEHNFHYAAWKSNSDLSGPDQYVIVSAGEDGQLENSDFRMYEEGTFASFTGDIVFRSGSFIRRPEGTDR